MIDFGGFFRIFRDFCLTKHGFGCRLYDIGSIWSRCSPQKRQRSRMDPEADAKARAKKNQKIFAKAFDKAQKCAIVYITRLIRRRL